MRREHLVIYCSRCQMWFDTKNGWHAKSTKTGLPLCPACGAPLFQIESDKFYIVNESRMTEVKTWEWPNGSLWRRKGIYPVSPRQG